MSQTDQLSASNFLSIKARASSKVLGPPETIASSGFEPQSRLEAGACHERNVFPAILKRPGKYSIHDAFRRTPRLFH